MLLIRDVLPSSGGYKYKIGGVVDFCQTSPSTRPAGRVDAEDGLRWRVGSRRVRVGGSWSGCPRHLLWAGSRGDGDGKSGVTVGAVAV